MLLLPISLSLLFVVCGNEEKDDKLQLDKQLETVKEDYLILNQSYHTLLNENKDLKMPCWQVKMVLEKPILTL